MTESVRPAAAGAGEGEDANTVYALGSSAGESARLQRQADELAPDSAALLDRVGLRPGQAAIDLGCGPRGILDLLAARVSPDGRVVGLDADPAHTAMAAEFASNRTLSGVEIVTADARHTGLPAGSFDLVHARTLLINLPDPAAVVTEMVRLAKPGGAVAVAEPDTEHPLCYPPNPAFDRICAIFQGRLQPQRRQPSDRPPGTGALPRRRADRRQGRVQSADVPTRELAADSPARPGARHAPTDRGNGTGQRGRA